MTDYKTKPRYELLDGLRGVAALMVIWFHIFEGFATSALDQKFNHGYLAVDFFFILSGFVIGYAYDDRWNSMSVGAFLKRRLIRLHPMVILAAAFGAASFIIQGCVQWDGSSVQLWKVGVAFILSILLLPAIPGTAGEVRGNGEMFPLNGPSWSLFFEYIGNILYALFLRRLSTRWLKVWTAACGLGYAAFAIFNGSGAYSMGVGWSLEDHNFTGGLLRLSFAFSAGLLLSRDFKPMKIRGAFPICSILVIAMLAMPYLGKEANWVNGLYDAVCTIAVFPLIVYMGASGSVQSKGASKFCSLLGDISYPLYIIHYPIMYLFYAWVWQNGYTFAQVWPVAAAIFAGAPLLAYACLKLYDEPVRKWLSGQ